MKKAAVKTGKGILGGALFCLAVAGATYWVSGRWDLAVIAGIILFAGVMYDAQSTYRLLQREEDA